MTLLNVFVGWVLGFGSALLLDWRSDRRKLKRRRQMLYLKIGRLMAAWRAFERYFVEASTLWEITSLDRLAETPQTTAVIREFIRIIGSAANEPPDFDELIETDKDRLSALVVLDIFDRSKIFAEDDRNIVLKADIVRRTGTCAAHVRNLHDAYQHFGGPH